MFIWTGFIKGYQLMQRLGWVLHEGYVPMDWAWNVDTGFVQESCSVGCIQLKSFCDAYQMMAVIQYMHHLRISCVAHSS